MDQIVTLLSVLGMMLLVGAYGFLMSGGWAPVVTDMLVPQKGPARNFLDNVGYAAILAATCWVLIVFAT